jgi:SAM-dependent methyltransferase
LSRALGTFGLPAWPEIPGRFHRYFSEWRRFRTLGGIASFSDLAPCLFDADPSTQTGGGHYFYQDVWALRHVASCPPPVHHDVGSRLDGFVAQVTAICPVVFWDLRPPSFQLPNFSFRKGSITELPLEDKALVSVSCLHVAEHIGLGRYGDPLDPQGTRKACRELARVLAPGGNLYFSLPVGKQRLCFNGHRIHSPRKILEYFAGLRLVELSGITDEGKFIRHIDIAELEKTGYGCGMFHFTRDEN